MTELLLFGAAFTIIFTSIIIGCKLTKKKNKKKNNQSPVVTFINNAVEVKWSNHNISFSFTCIDGQMYYTGAKCNEKYSCSISSSKNKNLPWKIWAEVGTDKITLLTDLKSKYEVI